MMKVPYKSSIATVSKIMIVIPFGVNGRIKCTLKYLNFKFWFNFEKKFRAINILLGLG